MARPTLFTHRKFRRLARALNSRALAVGSLELLWATANEAGDPLIGSAEDVEEIADWRGQAGGLVEALIACHFLDETPDGFIVHDHAHHAPTYVRRRRAREQARRTNGTPVTSQWRGSDEPLTLTPNSHLPSPITLSTPHSPPEGGRLRNGKTPRIRGGQLHPGLADWTCPHHPHCNARGGCERKVALDAALEAEKQA